MANVVVVGAGVVGTATGKGFAAHGHDVVFVDVSAERVAALRAEGLSAVTEVDLSGQPTFVFLTVPTPSNRERYDLSVLASATAGVGRALREAREVHTVVVRSTVPPGTCEGLVRSLLEGESGKVSGESFLLASNPEFLRAASALEDFLRPWMTVIASRSAEARHRLIELFAPFGGSMQVFEDPSAAELVKCAHNLYNATKISFWNEMWQVSRRLGVDPDSVATTVARSAEGSFNPCYGIRGGAPFGGACLPKDARGFLGFARDLGVQMSLLAGVLEVNEQMELLVNDELQGVGSEGFDDVAVGASRIARGNGAGAGSHPI